MKIREACIKDAERIAIVHVDSWITTYKGIISESYLSSLSVEKRTKSWLWTFENLNAHEKYSLQKTEKVTSLDFLMVERVGVTNLNMKVNFMQFIY